MRQPAGRKRVPATETRARLIDAGVEILLRQGLEVGMAHVTLERSLLRANAGCDPSEELSRSSAFNVWAKESDLAPQVAFQRAVVRQVLVAAGKNEEEQKATLEAAGTALEHMNVLTPKELLAELARVAGHANVDYIRSSQVWKLTTAFHGAAISVPEEDRDEELLGWIAEQDRSWRESIIEDLYKPIRDLLHLTPRPEFGDRVWDFFAASAQALAEGLVIRYMLDPELEQAIELDHPLSHGKAEWSLFSIGFEALVHRFFLFPDDVDPAETDQASESQP